MHIEYAIITIISLMLVFDSVNAIAAVSADAYEPDNSAAQASVLVLNDQNPDTQVSGYPEYHDHNFHEKNDQDWVKFYATAGETYRISVKSPESLCDVVITVFSSDAETVVRETDDRFAGEEEYAEFRCDSSGLYYVRLKQSEGTVFGDDTGYRLYLFKPVATFDGFVEGKVTPAGVETIITTTGKGEAITLPDGSFFMPHRAGTYTLTAIAQGYEPYEQSFTVEELRAVAVNINLTASGSLTCVDSPGGDCIANDLWIRAVIQSEEKGPIEAVWRKGGEDATTRGDRVIWGHFYANPAEVNWGNADNPDLFVKIWFDAGGRIDVNFFHVSVPDIVVYSGYPFSGTAALQGTTTMDRRYIRQYYENGEAASEDTYEDGNPPIGNTPSGTPVFSSTINTLNIGAIIKTEEKGMINGVWRQGGQATTTRNDQVLWGLFYASSGDVTWGSRDNPDLFVKIWFDAGGRIDVNFFHVSVPDIEVYSDYPGDDICDQKGTTIMTNRYIRHLY